MQDQEYEYEYLPEPRQQPFQSPNSQFGSSITILTNPENELYKMELSLRNMMLDKDGNPIRVGDPLLNEDGISSIIGQVQAIISQTTVLSNFDRRAEIEMLVEYLADTMAKDLMVNRIKYGIKSASARDKAYFIAVSSSFICMKRAFEQGEKRFWKGSEQNIRQVIQSEAANPGFFQKLLGFGKR